MKKPIDILKTYFETGDKPSQQQFADLIDSFLHKDDGVIIVSTATVGSNFVITYSDESTTELPLFPDNAPISFITGLQDILDGLQSFQEGHVLTDNNFTDGDVNNLAAVVEFVNNYIGYSQLSAVQLELDGVETGGKSVATRVKEYDGTITILPNQFLRVIGYASAGEAFSDPAVRFLESVFTLPAGTYGAGGANAHEPQDYLVFERRQEGERTCMLSNEYPRFGLNYTGGDPENPQSSNTQENFNKAIYKETAAIYRAAMGLRGRNISETYPAQVNHGLTFNFNEGFGISFGLTAKVSFADGEIFSPLASIGCQDGDFMYRVRYGVEGTLNEGEGLIPVIILSVYNMIDERVDYIWKSPTTIKKIDGSNEDLLEFGFMMIFGVTIGDATGIVFLNGEEIDLEDWTQSSTTNADASNDTSEMSMLGGSNAPDATIFTVGYLLGNIQRYWLNEPEGDTCKSVDGSGEIIFSQPFLNTANYFGKIPFRAPNDEIRALDTEDVVDYIAKEVIARLPPEKREVIIFIGGQNNTGFTDIDLKKNTTDLSFNFEPAGVGQFSCPDFDKTKHILSFCSFGVATCDVKYSASTGKILTMAWDGGDFIGDDTVFSDKGWIKIEEII